MKFMINMTLVYFELRGHVCPRAIRCSFHRLLPRKQPQRGLELSTACLECWDEGQLGDLRGGIKAITWAVMSSEEGLAVAEFSNAFSSSIGHII